MRWLVIVVLAWLVFLTALTLIAVFRHSTATHVGQPVITSSR